METQPGGYADPDRAEEALHLARLAQSDAAEAKWGLSAASEGVGIGGAIGAALAIVIHCGLYGLGGGVFWMALHGVFGWPYVIWALLAGRVGLFWAPSGPGSRPPPGHGTGRAKGPVRPPPRTPPAARPDPARPAVP